MKVSCKKGANSTRKLALTFLKTAFSKQRTRIVIISIRWHENLSSFVHGNGFLCAKIISVRFGVKLKLLSRKWNGLNTRKASLQGKFFYSNYLRVSDDHFAVWKMALDKLSIEKIVILPRIRVWKNKRGHPNIYRVKNITDANYTVTRAENA